MNDRDVINARLALENAELCLNREQPNVRLALDQVQKALAALGGKYRK